MGLCDIVAQRHLTAARAAQLAALAPFTPHPLRDTWGLTRAPRPAGVIPSRTIARRDALLAGILPGVELPRELAGVLVLDDEFVAVNVSISRPIPFPFVLTSLTLIRLAGTATDTMRVRFFVVDNDSGSDVALSGGDEIHQQPQRKSGIGNGDTFRGITFSGTIPLSVPIPVPQMLVHQPGRRIAMRCTNTAATTALLNAIWTVREILAPAPRV